jgi:hypothetical protein
MPAVGMMGWAKRRAGFNKAATQHRAFGSLQITAFQDTDRARLFPIRLFDIPPRLVRLAAVGVFRNYCFVAFHRQIALLQ